MSDTRLGDPVTKVVVGKVIDIGNYAIQTFPTHQEEALNNQKKVRAIIDAAYDYVDEPSVDSFDRLMEKVHALRGA